MTCARNDVDRSTIESGNESNMAPRCGFHLPLSLLEGQGVEGLPSRRDDYLAGATSSTEIPSDSVYVA